ncbi:hypothetical protein KR018_009445, partial [Drosophila ironensis]
SSVVMDVVIALLAAALSLVVWFVHQNYTYWQRRGIPHDRPNFPHGNTKEFMKTKQLSVIIREKYMKYKKTDGPFVGFYFYFKKFLIVKDIEFVKTVLIREFDKFSDRGSFYNERDDPLSNHLGSIEGQKWKTLRQKLTPTFSSSKVKNMFQTVHDLAGELVRVFEDSIVAGKGAVEITDLLARFTADAIGCCAFGLDCNSLRDPNAEFVRMGKTAILERPYGNYLDILIFGAPKLAAKLRLRMTLQKVEDFFMKIVRETVEYRVKNNVKQNDFMDMLIEMKLKYDNGNQKDGLTLNEIAAQAYIFFLAGFETSSTSMGFALYELALNQDVQDKLRLEIDSVFRKTNGQPTYENICEITYLEKVVNEIFRKHPVVAHLNRVATHRYEHSDPKYYIECGTSVIVPVLAIHHDPEFYPEPEKFIPERFDEDAVKKRPACSFLPFGDGPHNCIGLRFGRMQILVGLSMLIYNYKFEVHPTKTQVPLEYRSDDILLNAKGGITLSVSRI